MIFSQTNVARYLGEHFECSWQSVRPVPRVHVDFGGGTTLERTVLGNIATWYCFADGVAFDVLPGLVDADEFLARAAQAVAAHEELRATPDRHAAVGRYHSTRQAVRNVLPGGPADISKLRVERGLEVTVVAPPPALRFALNSKGLVEQPIATHLGTSVSSPNTAASLALDTAHNKGVRYAQAHALMAAQPAPVTPADLHRALFDRVLHVPLDDPFLGLAPHVLGGEGGRTIGARGW